MLTLNHVLIATNLDINAHVMVHTGLEHAQPPAKITSTNNT